MGRAIIVHGGAGLIPPDRYDAAREGCRAAAAAGWRVLAAGGSALDAVEAAVMTLENDPGFNAGTGAVLTSDGRAQLDCGVMDGASLNVGAIAGVERIKNPIQVARAVLISPHVLLVGAGAEAFASEAGIALCDPSDLITPYQYARWRSGYRPGDGAHAGTELDVAPANQSATTQATTRPRHRPRHRPPPTATTPTPNRYTPTTRSMAPWARSRSMATATSRRRPPQADALASIWDVSAIHHYPAVATMPRTALVAFRVPATAKTSSVCCWQSASPISSPPGFPRREPPPPPFGCWASAPLARVD